MVWSAVALVQCAQGEGDGLLLAPDSARIDSWGNTPP